MDEKTVTLFAVGDIILKNENPELYFELVAPTLRSGDVVIGQGEIPYTNRPARTTETMSAEDPESMRGLTYAGFNVITLTGNHMWDAGVPGIEDTITWLKEHNITPVGTGMNIDEARHPAIIEKKNTRVGILSYNCVGPKETWASPTKPGSAYVNVLTHYELDHAVPGGTPTVYTFSDPETLDAMLDDIRSLRSRCDVLAVSLHKGIIHTPAKLARYELDVSHAAIDAGADLILGHHAHILKGIEVYKGKIIFHGLNQLVAILPSLAPNPGQDKKSWAQKRKRLYNFEPDPENQNYPFHPDSKQTIIAKCIIENGKIEKVTYLPCLINKQGQPEILKHDNRGEEIFEYMKRISAEAELNAHFVWDGDEVLIGE
jgi:poly-gamma-glutamate capsule biosynthesis protein CapA/YwtB (metallophosphatase superfamily)